jgi:hypothetical protein
VDRFSLILHLAWLLLAASACPGTAEHLPQSRQDNTLLSDGAVIDGAGNGTDNLPCPTAGCGPNRFCVDNVCRKTCAQSSGQCNESGGGCSADEICRGSPPFLGVCFPAPAKLNDPCDNSTMLCAGGTVCVQLGSAEDSRCRQLCKYGCPAGTSCGTVDGCDICAPA